MNNYIFTKRDVPQVEFSINADTEDEARKLIEHEIDENDGWLFIYSNEGLTLLKTTLSV